MVKKGEKLKEKSVVEKRSLYSTDLPYCASEVFDVSAEFVILLDY